MSILCVISNLDSEKIAVSVAAAQEKALQFGVPMALVYCAPSQDKIKEQQNRLEQVEAKYAGYNLPLLTVIGDHSSALSTLKYHFQPVAVFNTAFALQNVHHDLRPHPHNWPGPIITVGELVSLSEIGCVF